MYSKRVFFANLLREGVLVSGCGEYVYTYELGFGWLAIGRMGETNTTKYESVIGRRVYYGMESVRGLEMLRNAPFVCVCCVMWIIHRCKLLLSTCRYFSMLIGIC